MTNKHKKSKPIVKPELTIEQELHNKLIKYRDERKRISFMLNPNRSNMANRIIMVAKNTGKKLYTGKEYKDFLVTDELISAIEAKIISIYDELN